MLKRNGALKQHVMSTENLSIEKFHGVLFSSEEKQYRLKRLGGAIALGEIDEAFIPYLVTLNGFSILVTTQCCTGHGGDNQRMAHVDFRSNLPPREVFECVLTPLVKLFPENVTIQIYGLEGDRLRYCVYMSNDLWEEITRALIDILGDLHIVIR